MYGVKGLVPLLGELFDGYTKNSKAGKTQPGITTLVQIVSNPSIFFLGSQRNEVVNSIL